MKGLSYPKYQIKVKDLRMKKKENLEDSVTNQFLSDFFEQHEQKPLDKIVIEKEIDSVEKEWILSLSKELQKIVEDLMHGRKAVQRYKKRTGLSRQYLFMMKEKLKRNYLNFMFNKGYNLYEM